MELPQWHWDLCLTSTCLSFLLFGLISHVQYNALLTSRNQLIFLLLPFFYPIQVYDSTVNARNRGRTQLQILYFLMPTSFVLQDLFYLMFLGVFCDTNGIFPPGSGYCTFYFPLQYLFSKTSLTPA